MTLRPQPEALRVCVSLLYGGVLILLLFLTAHAQSPEPAAPSTASAAGPRSRLMADRWIDRILDGEPVTFLYGNVLIDRDTLTARSDTARYYRKREIYEMWGNVRIRQHATVLTCPRAVYRRQAEAADFLGGVRVEEEGTIGTAERGEFRQGGRLLRLLEGARLVAPEYTIWADSISRDRETDLGEASGNVKIVDPQSSTLVKGDHAVFSGDGQSAVVDRNPVLTTREEGAETLEGRSAVMHFYRAEQRVVMVDSVQIHQGRTQAQADTAEVLGRQRLILRGNPQVRIGQQSTMTGQRIEFFYRRNQLRRIILVGHARMEDADPDSLAARYVGLPSLDVLEGDSITVQFEDSQVQRSTVVGQAHSIYVPSDLEDEIAFNDVRGDTINIFFRDEKVHRVQVQGTMSGTYSFARLGELAAPEGSDFLAEPDSIAALAGPAPAARDSLIAVAEVDSSAIGLVPGVAVPDSGRIDFLNQAQRVDYSGGEVIFRLTEHSIDLQREASLTYGTMTLNAEEVRFDTEQRELYASGTPLLIDSDQRIVGQQMGYNFEHKSGATSQGVTSFDGNFYVGKEIKRFADGTLKIHSGRMTSCDLAKPHYHFWSDKMKIKLKDKVVAKPVVLKIGEVPLFALPFYFKSLKSGRRSGILFPSFNFGWSQRTGRYIRNFGYYWATSDYTDFRFEGDYNERSNFAFRISNRYVKRYGFNGSVNYTRKISLGDEPRLKEWQLQWSHNQEALFDAYTLRASVQMASRTLSSNDLSSDTGRDIISGQLASSLYLSRSWSFMNGSLSLSRDERVNAVDDDLLTDNLIYTQVLPSLSIGFRKQSVLPQLAAGKKGSFAGDLLRSTYFNHSYSLSSKKQRNELTAIRTYSGTGNMSLEVRPPRVGIFNLSTGVSARQSWTRSDTTGSRWFEVPASDPDNPDSLITELVERSVDGNDEDTRPSLSVNTSLGTTLYGLFPLRLGRLQAIRHTVRFGASHSWRPALGSKQLRGESFGLSLNQRFDVKYLGRAEQDSALQQKKLDGVLDWTLTTTYNPNAPADARWSDISSSLAIKPGQSRNLNFKVSNAIDPYDWKLLNTRLSYGLNLRGRLDTGGQIEEQEPDRNQAIDLLGVESDSTLVPLEDPTEAELEEEFFEDAFAGFERRPDPERGGEDRTGGGRFLPWTFTSNISYNRNNISRTSTARANLSVTATLSRYWDLRYSTSLDLNTGQLSRQEWNLKRDLHCWALEFSRTVSEVDSQFGFRLYLKSIPAIKVTRGKDDLLGTVDTLGGGIF